MGVTLDGPVDLVLENMNSTEPSTELLLAAPGVEALFHFTRPFYVQPASPTDEYTRSAYHVLSPEILAMYVREC